MFYFEHTHIHISIQTNGKARWSIAEIIEICDNNMVPPCLSVDFRNSLLRCVYKFVRKSKKPCDIEPRPFPWRHLLSETTNAVKLFSGLLSFRPNMFIVSMINISYINHNFVSFKNLCGERKRKRERERERERNINIQCE